MSEHERYAPILRVLHWLVAPAILAQLALGWVAENTSDDDLSGRLFLWHFRVGVLLFALISLRACARAAYGAPKEASAVPWYRRYVAGVVHAMLYATLFALPISGYVIWVWMEAPMRLWGAIEIPRLFVPPADDETGRAIAWYVHLASAWTLAILSSLHIAAALWHQFVLRDRLIARRML